MSGFYLAVSTFWRVKFRIRYNWVAPSCDSMYVMRPRPKSQISWSHSDTLMLSSQQHALWRNIAGFPTSSRQKFTSKQPYRDKITVKFKFSYTINFTSAASGKICQFSPTMWWNFVLETSLHFFLLSLNKNVWKCTETFIHVDSG